MARPIKPKLRETSSANLGFEAKLRLAAEQGVPAPHWDAPEYTGGCAPALGLGLIFLKNMSDTGAKAEVGMQNEDVRSPIPPSSFFLQTSVTRWRQLQFRATLPTTRRLAVIVPVRKDLALRGIEADFGPENADTFRRAEWTTQN